MATVKTTSTTFTREYSLDDGSDDKAAIKLRLSVPFDLAIERAMDIFNDTVHALEVERDEYLNKQGISRQGRLIPRGPLVEVGQGTRRGGLD